MMALFAIPAYPKSPPLQEIQQRYIANYVEEASASERLEPALLRAVIRVESAFNHRAVSRAGATGLMQIMPMTAAELGKPQALDHRNPRANILTGAHYLRSLIDRFRGDLRLAVAAYNAGPKAVIKYRGVPPYPETRRYVKKVFAALAKERKEALSRLDAFSK